MKIDKIMRDLINSAYTTTGIPIASTLANKRGAIALGLNQRVQLNSPILHAELDAISAAGRGQRYDTLVLYTTLAPCLLCAGAIVFFNIPKVIFADKENFYSPKAFELLWSRGIETEYQKSIPMINYFYNWKTNNYKLWNEDINQ